MPWIKVIPPADAGPELREAMMSQRSLYPTEYGTPVEGASTPAEAALGVGIVSSHSLIPQALYHAFATFGSLMSPELPLTRRQHEMIAATVSSINRCHY